MKLRRTFLLILAALVLGVPALGIPSAQGVGQHGASGKPPTFPGGFKHLVVIYEENHSFDNLYGGWGSVGGQDVDGLDDATAARTTQIAQDGTPYACLLQDDVNLTSPTPLPTTCADTHTVYNTTNPPGIGTVKSVGFQSHFPNQPFLIDDYIGADARTCPLPPNYSTPSDGNGIPDGSGASGGCTRDLVHRFYQEQYQLNGGAQNRYVTGSDAVGLSMGLYDTKSLPLYDYLHSAGSPHYVIADRFFQAAFGGSFLNHQWLIAARTPLDTSHGTTGVTRNSVLDDNGMVNTYPLYKPTKAVTDGALTRECPGTTTVDDPEAACGDFAVNTVQPFSDPWNHSATAGRIPLIDDDDYPNIGDRMTDAGISWNWYSGGWKDAVGDEAVAGAPGKLFQYHHQPFNYFADYAPGQPGRKHLKDEKKFRDRGQTRSPADRELRQALRIGERAPRIRE